MGRRGLAALVLAAVVIGGLAAVPAHATTKTIAAGTIVWTPQGTATEPELLVNVAQGCKPSTPSITMAMIDVHAYMGHRVKIAMSDPGTQIPPASISKLIWTVYTACSPIPGVAPMGEGTISPGHPSTTTIYGPVLEINGLDGQHINQGYVVTLVS